MFRASPYGRTEASTLSAGRKKRRSGASSATRNTRKQIQMRREPFSPSMPRRPWGRSQRQATDQCTQHLYGRLLPLRRGRAGAPSAHASASETTLNLHAVARIRAAEALSPLGIAWPSRYARRPTAVDWIQASCHVATSPSRRPALPKKPATSTSAQANEPPSWETSPRRHSADIREFRIRSFVTIHVGSGCPEKAQRKQCNTTQTPSHQAQRA